MLLDSRKEVTKLNVKLQKQEKAEEQWKDQLAELNSCKEVCNHLERQLKEAKAKELAAQTDWKEWKTKVDELERKYDEAVKKLGTAVMKPAPPSSWACHENHWNRLCHTIDSIIATTNHH